MSDERAIAVSTHGRYLIAAPRASHDAPRTSHPAPLLVGFHGYAEDAASQLDRLQTIPGAEAWIIVSIQGLHRFYHRQSDRVIASWMTRQNRELMISDNVMYVSAVVESVSHEYGARRPLVFAGFSQGVAMAFRAAALGDTPPDGVIALGGDVPPELDRDGLARIPSVLLGRGERDEWYSAEKFEADQARLSAAHVRVTRCPLPAGHEWTAEFSHAAGTFLNSLL